jgi:predicted Rossmann fold flavoprotein
MKEKSSRNRNHDGRTERRRAALAIVGGGAAGMFAAAVAAERKIPCVLFERKARLGSKVLMTANGRCNFTKDISAERFLEDLGSLPSTRRIAAFAADAVRECPPAKIISGFRSLHVPLRRMNDGRMFPQDGKAATIVHAFGDLLRDSGVPIISNCAVTGVSATERGFTVTTENFSIEAENVLLATGGVSYPKTGSVGDGQRIARTFGHTVTPYRAGLIGLETNDRRVIAHAPRRFEDARARLIDPSGRTVFDYRGEIDCERFGLSGAAVYNAQRFLSHYGDGAERLKLEVEFGGEKLAFVNLKSRPLKEAIVTIGGVATDEIDPHTMESKIVPHLYFAGEVIDIDGPTGGYNLTLAFATARKAVLAVQRQLNNDIRSRTAQR